MKEVTLCHVISMIEQEVWIWQVLLFDCYMYVVICLYVNLLLSYMLLNIKMYVMNKFIYVSNSLPLKGPPIICSSQHFSSPEQKAHEWANSIPVTVVRQHFQTFHLKPLGQLNSNYIWRLLRMGEPKFVQMILITWPRWLPRTYMVNPL